jgi:hypothetical protein
MFFQYSRNNRLGGSKNEGGNNNTYLNGDEMIWMHVDADEQGWALSGAKGEAGSPWQFNWFSRFGSKH